MPPKEGVVYTGDQHVSPASRRLCVSWPANDDSEQKLNCSRRRRLLHRLGESLGHGARALVHRPLEVIPLRCLHICAQQALVDMTASAVKFVDVGKLFRFRVSCPVSPGHDKPKNTPISTTFTARTVMSARACCANIAKQCGGKTSRGR